MPDSAAWYCGDLVTKQWHAHRLASQAAAQQASQAAVAVSAAQHAMASQPLQVGGEVFNSSMPLLAGPLPQMQPFDLQPATGPDGPDPL